ncbi:unnamed protein product [Lampetra planeri]
MAKMCSRRRHRQTTNAAKNAADGGRGLGTTPQRPPCYGAASLQGDVARAALDTARSAASSIRSAGCGNASPLRAAPPCRRRVWVGGANNSAPGIRTTPAVAAAASTVNVFHDATRLDASPSLGNKRRTQNSQIRSSKLGLRESAAALLPQTHRASARPRWLISGRAVKKFRAVAAMLVAPGDRWRHRDRSQKTPGGDAVATAATAATAVNAAAASGAATHRREGWGVLRRLRPAPAGSGEEKPPDLETPSSSGCPPRPLASPLSPAPAALFLSLDRSFADGISKPESTCADEHTCGAERVALHGDTP